MTVKSILDEKGREVVTIEPTALLETAANRLAIRHIGALVVLGADQRVVGILSERDVVRALANNGASALKEPLSNYMTRGVVTCHETETVVGVMELMTARKFRHIPVVEGERLAGIISIGDMVKRRLHEMEQETNALQDYIRTA